MTFPSTASIPRLFPCAWIPFSARMPLPVYAPDPKIISPVHGAILVTNAVDARNRWGAQAHAWLVSGVHEHKTEIRNGSYVEAYAGEITAYTEERMMLIHGLTHWRPAVPEEWKYDVDGLPTRCIVSTPNN